ncbi:MAG: DUF2318 domain-containing protein [Desulfocapsaceae bacterium]|jgi:uncharacterized membrane protein
MYTKRTTRSFVLSVFIFCFLLLLSMGNASGFSLFSQHKTVKSVDGTISIALSKVNDGKAHYFVYDQGDLYVKFFVVKSVDGAVRAAFDACDVCFPAKKGYTQDGDFMICNNCGRRFHSSRINVEQGGCNPAPLKRTVVGDQLVINVADIAQGTRYF